MRQPASGVRIAFGAGGGHNGIKPLKTRSGDRLGGPGSRINVHGALFSGQVHRYQGELQRCPSLHEQDAVVVGQVHQATHTAFGRLDDLIKGLGAMTHLHNGHSALVVIEQFSLDLLQNGQRQGGWSGIEVMNALNDRGFPSVV
ncbi:MAG: hypothetical protein P8X96_20345 [Desulfobacteraceae bacterium]